MNKPNTPKSDLWKETLYLINNFMDSPSNDPSGLTPREILEEHRDLQRKVNSGFGASPNETQADRDMEIENCISYFDLQTLSEFHKKLSENISRLKSLIDN